MARISDVEIDKLKTKVSLLRLLERQGYRPPKQGKDYAIPCLFHDGDITMRLIRAITVACKAEPSLNTWYDSHALGRRVLKKIDLGIAVDTQEGLFVPVLRDVGNRTPDDLRKGLNAIKQAVRERNIPPEEMRGYTFTLSNFGVFSGRYANPIVFPPPSPYWAPVARARKW